MRKLFCLVFVLLSCTTLFAQSKPVAGTTKLAISSFGVFQPNHLSSGDTIQYSTPLTFCEGGNVVLTANGAPTSAAFQWKKDGADISGATSVNYTATTSGSYSVVVTASGTPTTYAPVVVTVNPAPNAGFTFSPNGECSNIPVGFNNTSSGSGLTYNWSFGDPASGGNNSSTGINPSHEFVGSIGSGTQNFTVSLTATNTFGCSATANNVVSTKQLPHPKLGGTGEAIYDGQPYFTSCTPSASLFTFTNQSTTTNSSYIIQWGDGSPDFTSTSFSLTTHTYGVGTHVLSFIVTGSNGCKDTGIYNVFVGSNPAIGLSNPGNTNICTGSSLTFPITSTDNNPPGTTYRVTFNDGTTPITYTHPAPASVTHLFTQSSCGTTSSNGVTIFPNSFSASIVATNPCGTSAAAVVPIYVSKKPVASFSIAPKDTICVGRAVTITNTSPTSFSVNPGGASCSNGKMVWSISPSTGYTMTGTLGNDFGTNDPSLWQTGTSPLTLNFTTPGTYTIKLKVGGNTLCGVDSITRVICVNPAPTAAFTVNQITGCAPLVVSTTNASNTPTCGNNTYDWSVTYVSTAGCDPSGSSFSYVGGTSASSENPQFQFNNPGVYTIRLVTKNSAGLCLSTAVTQTITVKAKPKVSLVAIPPAVCQNATISPAATVTCYINSASTYAWSFPGGTPSSSTATTPGSIAYNTPGTYLISLAVTNECGTTTVSQNITVNSAATVSVPSNQTLCAGSPTGLLSFTASPSGTITWTNNNTAIGLPASGSGNINSFVAQNPTAAPITATINATASAGCPGSGSSFTITVNPRPAKPAVVRPINYCQNATASPLQATPSASDNTLTWYDNSAFTGGSPTAPTPSTTTPGTSFYYVTQTNSYGCKSDTARIPVTIAPNIAGNTIASNQTVCSGTPATTLAGTVLSGGSGGFQYQWQLSTDGGVIWTNIAGATSATYSPGLVSTTTMYRRIVNSGGCQDISNVITITVLGTLSNFQIAAPQSICAGAQPALLDGQTPSGGSGTFTYQWEGSPNNSTWTAIPGATLEDYQPPVLSTTTYYRRRVSSGLCSAISTSITITVTPLAKPSVVSPVIYCLNATAVPLSATAGPGNSLTWFDNPALSGGTSTPPTPSTSTAGITTYYVTQNNGSCQSDTARIHVTVNALIGGNNVGPDQSLCAGGSPSVITPTSTLSGGATPYSYVWQVSTDGGGTWSNVAGATGPTYLPPSPTVPTKYRRIVSGGGCSSESNVVTISVEGTLSNYGIGTNQVVCSGTQPALLVGEIPTGGSGSYVFHWESSPNGTLWTPIAGATLSDFQPAVLTATTHYRRKVNSGPCSIYSSSVIITVNPKPILAAVPSTIHCNNASVPAQVFNPNPSASTIAWSNDNSSIGLAASGSGNVPSFTATNSLTPKVPQVAMMTVTPTYSSGGTSCVGTPVSYTLTVLPTIAISPINDTTVCTGALFPSFVPEVDAAPFPGSSVTYSWTVSGSGVTLSSGSGSSITSFTSVNNGVTDLTATITITPRYTFNGKTCDGTPETYTIVVKPGTPPANAGADKILCAASTYTMTAVLSTGTTGQWLQLSGAPVVIVTPNAPNTEVTGLVPGSFYQFEWAVTGFSNCPPRKDTITLDNKPPLENDVDTSTKVICLGQALTINGALPSGGSGSYTYQWQFSPDGISYSNISGATSQSLSFTPTGSGFVRRIVTSLPCIENSLAAYILVQAALSNNAIGLDTAVCIGTPAGQINGSAPSGGSGAFIYQWQQSVDGGTTWNLIVGAVDQHYTPGILTQTTKYRRVLATTLCAGPQSNTSNVVTVTVRPDARANLIPTDTLSCPPFVLTSAVVGLQTYPLQNSQYNWYVNSVPIGSGSAFPGYTITAEDDTAIVKVVAVSLYGCRNDSMEVRFRTPILPHPGFTLSDTVGCGPLSVNITNTTPNPGLFTYQWNFGNGVTSTSPNPGLVVFQSNPNYRDTIYQVSLKVLSACDTIQIVKGVRVKSKPKALFTPNISIGCSPMRVVFNNTSLGIGNTYTWDFGDGRIENTTTLDTISHTFISGVRDTFYVKLTVVNECGIDSMRYAIVVLPNTIRLDFAVNGNEQKGCAPHTVRFINNTSGATAFQWNFGDGNILSTTAGIDTITHTYTTPGSYIVRLRATNSCSDTTTTEIITVYPTPDASFSASRLTACLGDTIRFTNLTDSATSYLWTFGDGATSTLIHPNHIYSTPGTYTVRLKSYRLNAPGIVCEDSASKTIIIVSTLNGWFDASDTVGTCAPFTVTFTNRNGPSSSAVWDFGDGTTGSGNIVTHTYNSVGTYLVRLTTTTAGGCTYINQRTVRVLGPGGSLGYIGGFVCDGRAVRFQATVSSTDSLLWNFGDGTTLTTTDRVVFHSYANPGVYLPSVTLLSNAGCRVTIPGVDTIRVDKIQPGFTATQTKYCGYTSVAFTDTSHIYFGTALVRWNFGDGTTGTGSFVTHAYTNSGVYPLQMIVTSNSGCSDTVSRILTVQVNNQPTASIDGPSVRCASTPVTFTSLVTSTDAVTSLQWSASNGSTGSGSGFTISFANPGTYLIRLIAGTVNGCYDTATHTITINPKPDVVTSTDRNICKGSSVVLNATGAPSYSWSPLSGLSCTTCPNPTATPNITTAYIVTGTNSFGCSASDTVVLTVIPPFDLRVSPDDSICVGSSSNLLASGATSYSWSPATGLSATNISNPIASPSVTTRYRVVGYDGFNCFTDTAFVLVAVGQYPVVDLGPDLTLSTGTLHPLTTTITNGPIRSWVWSPTDDLNCSTCPRPIATIKREITYQVEVTNNYGCKDRDTITIKTFCESSQIFVPNAFTPDNDGVNDVLYVRGKGIATVKTFRIFNRWGELVFERSNFPINDLRYAWDGKVRGQVGPPDVFVYTAEVVCDNGTPYTYKGNVSIIK